MVATNSSTNANSKATNGVKENFNNQKSISSASAGLKAMLGVNTVQSEAPSHQSPKPKIDDASAGLKALLGVNSSGSVQTKQNEVTALPTPATAADALLQMMSKNHQAVPQPYAPIPNHQSPPPSKFNFSYVEDGQQPEEPINQPILPTHPYAPNMPYPIIPQVHGTNYNPGIMPSHMMMVNPGPPMGYTASSMTPSPMVPTVPVASKREKRNKKIDSENNESFLVPSVAISAKK